MAVNKICLIQKSASMYQLSVRILQLIITINAKRTIDMNCYIDETGSKTFHGGKRYQQLTYFYSPCYSTLKVLSVI
jgi:hypothetical protein